MDMIISFIQKVQGNWQGHIAVLLATALVNTIIYFIQIHINNKYRGRIIAYFVRILASFVALEVMLSIISTAALTGDEPSTQTHVVASTTVPAASQTITSPPAVATTTPTANPSSVLRVGDTYRFGRYEQNSTQKNGAEAIEWIVLATDDNGALLISRYVLDCVPYHDSRTAVTWETCSLRQWMNHSFYMEAFTDAEQAGILPVKLTNEDNPVYGTRGGNTTEDRIFALSVSEARKYLSDSIRNTQGTVYARAQGAKLRTETTSKNVYWWLRTPGQDSTMAMKTMVSTNDLDYEGNPICPVFSDGRTNNTGVRPCLWLRWDYILANPQK